MCEREREGERGPGVCMCVREREREGGKERERERERERHRSVCVKESVRMRERKRPSECDKETDSNPTLYSLDQLSETQGQVRASEDRSRSLEDELYTSTERHNILTQVPTYMYRYYISTF